MDSVWRRGNRERLPPKQKEDLLLLLRIAYKDEEKLVKERFCGSMRILPRTFLHNREVKRKAKVTISDNNKVTKSMLMR